MAHQVGQSSVTLFALVIGIDDYPKLKWGKLRGAVADARAIKQYLQLDLQVPEDHILALFDKDATRAAIIAAFRNLQDDERIRKGDPIVIFYSGHGCERESPPAWNLNSKTQCLVPHDCETEGAKLLPIPDRTLGRLIEDIARVKGDNITVIFDCCHSASGTRGLDDDDECPDDAYTPRSVDLRFDIPETLDDHIWGGQVVPITNRSAYHGLQSHVLLAACREQELAYEHKGRGLFTGALLAALRSCFGDGITLTYAELLQRILLKHESGFKKRQHPQCEGFNQNRILFDAKVSSGGQVFYPVIRRGGSYVISAGRAHGVSLGRELNLYDTQKRTLASVPVDEHSLIDDYTTTITSLPLNVSFAKLNHILEIPLYVDPQGPLSTLTLEALLCDPTNAQKCRLVKAEEAKLEVAMKDNLVIFKVLDERLQGFGLTELPYEATLRSVARVLSFAAKYYWFFDLAKEYDKIDDDGEVAVDLYRLKIAHDDYGDPFLSPDGAELWHTDRIHLDGSDIVDLIVDPDMFYEFKITNKTSWDLYLNVFMFNCSSFSIDKYYIQSSAGDPEAPFKRGETFTIGYGNGTPPLSFELEGNQNVDVSFLKIFFATRPIDMSDVAQKSPFDGIDARDSGDDGSREGGGSFIANVFAKMAGKRWLSRVRGGSGDSWFTLVIPVVQRRAAV